MLHAHIMPEIAGIIRQGLVGPSSGEPSNDGLPRFSKHLEY